MPHAQGLSFNIIALSSFLINSMIKIISIAVCCLLVTNVIQAQPCSDSFILKGKINLQKGTAYLIPLSSKDDYPVGHVPDSVKISNGIFTFSGSICYPYGFMLGVKNDTAYIYISDNFIIDPGTQSIICHADSLREIPFIENTSMTELNKFEGPLQAMHLDEMEFKGRHARYGKYLLNYAK